MKKILALATKLLLSLFFLLLFTASVSAFDLYSGSISTDNPTDNQINGTGWWSGSPNSPTSVSWEITHMGTYVHYKYIFNHLEHDASYFIIEVPDTFTDFDLTTGLTYQIATFSDDGTSNQGMPGSVYGIKFESFTSYTDHGDGTYTETIEFDSTRLPGWGDFYARAGVHPSSPEGHGAWDAAWNAGFLVSENTPNYDLNDGMHISVPFEPITTTTTTTIPDCVVDTDCEDDGIGCTDETCEAGTCVSTPNNANCSDDGAFCNGTEFCDVALDCSSTGDPCELPAVCNEGTDTCVADEDLDEDGIPDNDDNCPNTTNPLQLDTYPPQGNNIGDACDCEADFNCDGNVDAEDVTSFLDHFGRSTFFNPCTDAEPCQGDFDCNVNVDANDVNQFLEDFGRSQFFNPCPSCDGSPWCTYTTTTIPNGSACNPGDCGEGFCCCHIEGGFCGPSVAELCQTEEECADIAEFCLETVCLD